jgi:hypothetical protein
MTAPGKTQAVRTASTGKRKFGDMLTLTLNCVHGSQKGPDDRRQALGLVVWKPVTGVLNLLEPNA